jgi:hypothetical protein
VPSIRFQQRDILLNQITSLESLFSIPKDSAQPGQIIG